MRVIVHDEVGDIAFSYDTQKDTVSLCPGRLAKARVAAFFIMDGPAPTPDSRAFRQHVFDGDDGE